MSTFADGRRCALLTFSLGLSCWMAATAAAVDTTFLIDEQQSSLTIAASTVFVFPLSDSDTQPLGGTLDVTLDFGTSGAFPSQAAFVIQQSEVYSLNPFSLSLGAPPLLGVSVLVSDVVANTTTPDPPIVLTLTPGSEFVYQFDASALEVHLNQGTVDVSGTVNESIDLSESPVAGSAPAGTIGVLRLTPGSMSGAVVSVDAVLELPISISREVDFDGQIVTLDVDGMVIANSSFDVKLGGIPGDFNNDGVVDGADLDRWEMDFAVNAGSDADGDNDSDGHDFLTWQRQFGSGTELLASSELVPEPSCFALVVATLLFSLPRYGRR